MPGWPIFVFLVLSLPFQAISQSFPVNPEKLRYARELEDEAMTNKDSLMLAEAYYLYGKAYSFAGNAATSQSYFLKSLAVLESRGDSYELGRIYCRLSENRSFLRKGEGMKYIRLSLGVFERIGSLKGQVVAYGILGQLYDQQSRKSKDKVGLDNALKSFRKVESLGSQLKDTIVIGEANLQLADFYGHGNAAAIPFLEKALRFLSVKNSKRARLVAMTNLADAYIESNQLKRGYELAMAARDNYRQNHMSDIELEKGLELVLIKYYESTNQSKEALRLYKELNAKENHQFQKDKDEAFLRLQTEYETGKKDALLTLQKRELGLNSVLLQSQRNFMILAVGLLVLATGMSIVFFRISRKNRRTSQKNEQLVREQNHRVKNNLQMISSLLSMQARFLTDSDARDILRESRLRVQSMAIIQRKLYDGPNLAEVNLADFIPELAEAVLLACGYAEAKQTYLVDSVCIDVDRTTSVGLILTELVINACKYAFADNPEPLLVVECRQTGDEITLVVRDNGPGLDVKKVENFNQPRQHFKGNTFGTQLLELQVSQLYGDFQFENDKGTVFTMKFRK